jgi:hypothetical protein
LNMAADFIQSVINICHLSFAIFHWSGSLNLKILPCMRIPTTNAIQMANGN